MKKIIINGRFLLHRVTGAQRYAREICTELDKIVEPGEMTLAVPPEIEELPDYQNIEIVKVGRMHNRLWEHISFPIYVSKQRGISLNLCNVAPLADPGIVAILDVKIKATPQYFSKKFIVWYSILFKNAIERSKKIITISEFSKKEILKYYKIPANKIEVVPCAWQHFNNVGYDKDALSKYALGKNDYYFSMCSLEPNENFKWIAEVAKRNPKQIFAVSGSINEKVFADGLGFECPENMKLLGYVSDEEAKTLMRDCKAFLFPTFYEGFGIPPLEAISAGAKQVVVSDTEVMHEVFGDSVVYIDPMEYELPNNQIANNKESGSVLERYSWSRSAEMLLRLLRRVE